MYDPLIQEILAEKEAELGITDEFKSIAGLKYKEQADGKSYALSLGTTFMKTKDMKKVCRLSVRNSVLKKITLPDYVTTKALTSEEGFTAIEFAQKDQLYYDIVQKCIDDAVTNYQPSAPFACCSKYVECSDARKCLHRDQFYAKNCQYRSNLENNRIFYGKNKNSGK